MAAQWAILIALTALLVGGLELLRLPAALMLGSLAAAAALTVADVEVRVPPRLFLGAQAIVGCLIARVILPSTMKEMAHDWPTFLGGVLSVIVVTPPSAGCSPACAFFPERPRYGAPSPARRPL